MRTDVIEVKSPFLGSYKGTVRGIQAARNELLYLGLGVVGLYTLKKGAEAVFVSARRRKIWEYCKAVGLAIPAMLSPLPHRPLTSLAKIKEKADRQRPQAEEPEPVRPQTIIHPGATALIAGFTNTGKSILALQIAAAAAGGKDYLTLPDRLPMTAGEQKVLYISTEENIPLSRVDAVRAALGDKQANFEFESFKFPESGSERGTDDFVPLYNLLEEWVQKQRGDCMVVIDNLSVFSSLSKEAYAKDFYKKQDKLKTSYRQGGGRLTFLLVAHTADHHSCVKSIKGSEALPNHAWPILMHQQRDPKKESSPRYLVLRKLKDDRGGSDKEYDLDYRTEPFSHYELAAEDVNTDVNAQDLPAIEEAQPKEGIKNAPLTPEEIAKIQQLEQEGIPAGQIAERLGRSRPTVNKYRNNVKHKPKKPKAQEPKM